MGSVKQEVIRRIDELREACAKAPACTRCGGVVDDPDDGMCDWCNHIIGTRQGRPDKRD